VVSALGRKLGRDLWRGKGQVATIAVVLACGIMTMIMLRGTFGSLIAARDAYYDRTRFADVFAHLERAPEAVAARLGRIPGVAVVDTRIVEDVLVPLPEVTDPVTGRVISMPDTGRPQLNDLYLRAGRLPADVDEAVILAQFAEAHELEPGDVLPVVINGRLRDIRVVGIALSPEYVLAISGGGMPDNERFVVLWMAYDAVAPAFRMEGAFNDVTLRLEPEASLPAVCEAVDRELARYGGVHAVGRERQLSNYALSSELAVLRLLAIVLPAMFLGVAAFLVNVVVARLVSLERTQIAVLKALGFSDRRIARHYLAFVALIVVCGAVLGIATGFWAGRWMTELYADFYRFPTRVYRVSPTTVATATAVGLAAGITGALASVRRVVRLPPAQAMRPPAPPTYHRTAFDRLGVGRALGPGATLVVREIRRSPIRFALSSLGIAMGVAIFVMGRFSWDSFDYLMAEVYPREHHEDLTVTLVTPAPARALHEIESIPGVELAEGQRVVPVRIQSSSRWRDASLIGMPARPELRRLFDHGAREIELPPQGVVLTRKLAELLAVRVGSDVDVELLEGDFSSRTLLVVGVIDEPFGLQAYARADWLAEVLREQPRVSTLLLRVDPARLDDVRARLAELPAVLGVTSTEHVIRRYREQTGGSMLVVTVILTVCAAAISVGVVYNNARVALSMRGRDLATLRVLGFTRVEISAILLGELAVQVLAGIPLGLWLGTLASRLLSAGTQLETMRLPLHLSDRTYAMAALIALASGLASALLVRRKLDELDLVAVLKAE